MKTNGSKKGGRPIIFNMSSSQCVWAKAGVIGPTVCINAFNCLDCPLDRKLQARNLSGGDHKGPACDLHLKAGERDARVYADRKCRHMLSGRVASKYCVHDFDCATCAYNQMMEDDNYNLSVSQVDQDRAGGFNLARKYYYHRGHSWARVEYGGRVRVGLDDFSMRLVGKLDDFRLPGLGSMVHQGEPDVGIARGELRAETLSPIEGVVVAVNHRIRENPILAHKDPYGDGWMFKVVLADPADLETLMDAEEYEKLVEELTSQA